VCSRAGVALLGYPVVDVIVRLVLHIDIEYLLLRSLPLIFQIALKSLEIVEKLSFGMKVELSNTNLEYSTKPRSRPCLRGTARSDSRKRRRSIRGVIGITSLGNSLSAAQHQLP
jgi:hypothetical protein